MEAPVITDTVSHYTVLKKLGAGGRGEVYLAEDTVLNRRVAVKFLPHHSAANQQARQRLIREAGSSQASPLEYLHNLTGGQETGRGFTGMEYVESETQSALHTAKRLRPVALGCFKTVRSGYSQLNSRKGLRRRTQPLCGRINYRSIRPGLPQRLQRTGLPQT